MIFVIRAVVLPPFPTAQRIGAATARDTISSGGGYGYNHNAA